MGYGYRNGVGMSVNEAFALFVFAFVMFMLSMAEWINGPFVIARILAMLGVIQLAWLEDESRNTKLLRVRANPIDGSKSVEDVFTYRLRMDGIAIRRNETCRWAEYKYNLRKIKFSDRETADFVANKMEI